MIRLLVLLPLFCVDTCFPQVSLLSERIHALTSVYRSITGVAMIGPDSRDTLLLNNHHHFPMQSVYKFHLALAVLDRVDRGELSLDQMIHIRQEELMVETWSPMRDDHNVGDFELSVRELLRYTVSQSDNNGCDVLFRLVGGPKSVDAYIHGLGITDIAIAATEEEMQSADSVQYTNWSTPLSAAFVLQKLRYREILSEAGNNVLWDMMVQTSTGPKRLKGLLPAEAVVAHKTGTSGTNEKGISAATNDMGIVEMPDGKEFTLVVFVTDSQEDHEANEKIIADIARVAWDYFLEDVTKDPAR